MNKEQLKGYLYGILTAICWATSPVFIAKGLEGIHSSIWATAIGLLFATGIYLVFFLFQRKWTDLKGIKRKDLIWQMAAGLAGGFGILARNIALETTRVAIVIGLVQLQILVTLIIGPTLLGAEDKDKITPQLIAGSVLIIGGTALIIYGRNL